MAELPDIIISQFSVLNNYERHKRSSLSMKILFEMKMKTWLLGNGNFQPYIHFVVISTNAIFHML